MFTLPANLPRSLVGLTITAHPAWSHLCFACRIEDRQLVCMWGDVGSGCPVQIGHNGKYPHRAAHLKNRLERYGYTKVSVHRGQIA